MLSDNEDIFYECDKCRSEIGFANRISEISRSEGRFVKNHGKITTETLKEESLLILCAYCGSSSIDFNEIRNEISNNSDEEHNVWDDESCNGFETPLGNCDKCGTEIGIGEVVIKMQCSTGQIECNSPGRDIPDYYIDDSAAICTLCQGCGEKMNNRDLKSILLNTVVKSPFKKPRIADDCECEFPLEMNRRFLC